MASAVAGSNAVTIERNGTVAGVDAGTTEWQQALPVWLSYLIAAFPQARVGMMTYAVLEDVFQGYGPEVMKAAARAYVARHAFWPTAAELRPYVEWAEREAVRPATAAERHALRMAQVRAGIRFSDEEMLAWEMQMERAGMPAVQGEPVEDAATVARVLEAQEGMIAKGWAKKRTGSEGEIS